MYNTIKNPKTGRNVNIYSKFGKQIIRNYLKIIGGGGWDYSNTTPWELLDTPLDINITRKQVVRAYNRANSQAAMAGVEQGEGAAWGVRDDMLIALHFLLNTGVDTPEYAHRAEYQSCLTPTWTSRYIKGETYTFRNPWFVPWIPQPRMFRIGDSVIIRDLVNREDLNGCRGTIESFAESIDDVYRYIVSRRGAQTIEIKEPNLISTDLEEPRYNVGDDVEIQEFVGDGYRHNGRRGKITSEGKCPLNPLDVTYYRYDVELSPGETYSFREIHLRLAYRGRVHRPGSDSELRPWRMAADFSKPWS
tara:strand:- start:10910 stop:11824 length:915 start_codon:yes stop_codon:yes gene_type:complete